MDLLLIASTPLQPFCERLLAASPHRIELVSPARSIQAQLRKSTGYDAILLADGGHCIPSNGLDAGTIPLIIPRVHNNVAMLLGGAESYRRLFQRYNGSVCWMTPDALRPVYMTPKADCTCLCCLVDTSLGLRDNSLRAREIALKKHWDFFNAEVDTRLLEQLLRGDWAPNAFLTVPAGGSVALTYQHDLFA